MNNSFGEILRITIFGASHAESVGVIMEGVPQGLHLPPHIFTEDMERRRPQLAGETSRLEEDRPLIEGLDEECKTIGEYLRITIPNNNRRSKDYSHLKVHPRPSHADLVQMRKYGDEYDIAGGGIASGRMTAPLVAAGVVAKQILRNAKFSTRLTEVGGCKDSNMFDDIIANAAREGDSVGGIIECRVSEAPPLLGEPFFDSAESVIAHLLFSIPAVKGVEFGAGFKAAEMFGSEHNDPICDAEGHTSTNNAGGIVGGISNGNEIVVRAAIKPTPSISAEQQTYNFESGQVEPLVIKGRHDVCITLRAAVVEAAAAIALADLSLRA